MSRSALTPQELLVIRETCPCCRVRSGFWCLTAKGYQSRHLHHDREYIAEHRMLGLAEEFRLNG